MVLFYYGAVAFPLTSMLILCESWVRESSIRVFSYNATQYGWIFGVAAVNFIGLVANTIATQNERSGFITLIGYIGLVYAFMGDLLIFEEKLAWLEVLGISIVLCMNILLVCSKWKKQDVK